MLSRKMNQTELSRRDKRRHNIESKVTKVYSGFISNKDTYYKDRLTTLQTNLTTLHQGNNQFYVRSIRDLEEERDAELIRLRLYEEYRISRSSVEFQEDIEKGKSEYEDLVKLCKEKLYESIENKMKNLKEERLLMDIANTHSYAMDYNRTRFHKNTRSHTASGWESASNTDFASFATGKNNNNAYNSPNESTDTGANTDRRSLRRRVATKSAMGTLNSENHSDHGNSTSAYNRDGFTSGNANESDYNSAGKDTANRQLQSDSDFLQYLSDNSDLQTLLFGEDAQNNANSSNSSNKRKPKNSQRLSTKTAPPLASLSSDEVTNDIVVIRDLTGQPEAPFKVRTEQ
ncbi:hypothetical protein TPHA_0C03500 [Tetrapisispora phaffii CBS 4417]|uniref:Transcriptional regulatory protein SDS3 n=1 Tax=Tetrapisispora phaffii (strain ATCC 24235 / CBS 4417 / NBRC 1672 / NRRL Y-8282 / UCD 70-5) TaxID=1071381 RepID=G8BQJ0_TETPH|nr:hypothetical protein TPHA_0C03500 [Tetrapisispora phaffii CBS 4417]CCE62502.1 hypothetical protein TPHA_0C03500 [Tetrapisispora phaffii CBS 4417]